MSPVYDELGDAYDRMIDWPRRLARDVPAVKYLADEINATRVLDAACGTGHLAAALADEGLDVVGLDASEAMLKTARERHAVQIESGRLSFVAGDLRALNQADAERFGLILVLGNSLAYLHSVADLEQCMRSADRALNPGGAFLSQVVHWPGGAPRHHRIAGRDGQDVRYDRIQEAAEPGFYRMHIVKVDAEGREETIGTDRLRAWSSGELAEAATGNGFASAIPYGSFDQDPFDARTSRNLVLCARKEE